MYRYSSFIAHGTSCFYNIGSAQHRLHNVFQNEGTSCLWLPLVASHLTRLQFKVMDFSVAIVVVFVLHTDSMIGNVRLPQLPTDSMAEELPWPTETFWEGYPERAGKCTALPSHNGFLFVRSAWRISLHGRSRLVRGVQAYYINVPQTVSAVQVLTDIFCIRYLCCRGLGAHLCCWGFGGVYQP